MHGVEELMEDLVGVLEADAVVEEEMHAHQKEIGNSNEISFGRSGPTNGTGTA